MTGKFGAAVLTALALGGFAPQASAQTVKYGGAIGIEAHRQTYEEPSIAVEEKGWFGGLTLEGQANFDQWLMRADGRLAYGQMDYTGSGTVDDIDDIVFEARIVGGRTFALAADDSLSVTPYAGYGYRRLVDYLGGRTSSTGAVGYDRVSQYHYVPIGLEGLFRFTPSWAFKPTVEYDYFIAGKQDSYLFGGIENDQDSGYGFRASLMAVTTAWSRPIEFGPFMRYWDIDDSDVDRGFYEPANETLEVGVAVKTRF